MTCPSLSPESRLRCQRTDAHHVHAATREDGTRVTWSGANPARCISSYSADELPLVEPVR